MLGRTIGNLNNGKRGHGYAFLQDAVDDHSRLAYSEIPSDERKDTAAAFWRRARGFSAQAGVRVAAVMTDRRSWCRPRAFTGALGPDVKHSLTRP